MRLRTVRHCHKHATCSHTFPTGSFCARHSLLPLACCLQVVKIFEKILYAADAAEAKEAMLEAQQRYNAELPLESLQIASHE